MSKIKIFLSVFLILCLLVSVPLLVGCGGGDGDENGEGGAAEEQQEGDNGEGDGDDADDADDADDDDGDDDGDDADDDDADDDADDDSDDISTITDLLEKATNIDGVQWEVTMTNYEDVEVSLTTKDWIEGNNWRSEFEALITGESKVNLYDYDEGVWYDWVVGGDTANKYDLSDIQDAWESQTGDEIIDYSPTIVGTETIDGKTCTVVEYTTDNNQESKIWIWNAYGITLKIEVREAGQLTMKIEWNNVVVGDIDDSMFEVPAGMTIIDMSIPVV